MSGLVRGVALGPVVVMSACLSGCTRTGEAPGAAALESLQQRIVALGHRKSLIEDVQAIKRLQRAYRYYVDEALWDEVADLFAERASVEIGLDGVYRGRARIREYLYATSTCN